MALKITDRTRELATPVAKELGLEIWDVKYVKEGASYYLRIFIDKDGGVSIDDCEALARLMNDILDEEDFITDSYYFEVSSPGLGRELSRPEHFEKYIGEDIRVRLYKAVDGTKQYRGKLLGYGDTLKIETENGIKEFEVSAISKVNLLDDEF